jgi:methylated-DNA-protein-cysteine methyltransferase-like protein
MGSLAYANMRRALFEAVRTIPAGKVVETRTLAEALNIPPRHAAFILSQMTADEASVIPAHRVVPKGGDFGKPESRKPAAARQLARLRTEGHAVTGNRRIAITPDRLWQPDDRHRRTIWADEAEP